jgi:beta-lactamase regulating signal transducer with metallopeptidase domain
MMTPSFNMLIDVAARGAALLALAGVMAWLCRRAAATTRHLIWTVAVIGTLTLPVAGWIVPTWEVLPSTVREDSPSAKVDLEREHAVTRPSPAAPSPDAGVNRALARIDASEWAVPAWAVMASLLFLRFLAGVGTVRRLARHARPAGARWRALLDQVAAELSVRQPVRLLASADIAMPMTFGGTRPLLLIPVAASEWSDDRIRVVLLHELAHIRRADWLTHALGRLLVALHWFNPLAWVAMRAMTRERERACDDCVIAHGARPSDYAAHLLDIASAPVRRSLACAVAPAMARPSELEGRLLSILSAHARRSNKRVSTLVVLAAIGATLGVAAAGPEDQQAVDASLVSRLPSTPLRPGKPAPTARPMVGAGFSRLAEEPQRDDTPAMSALIDALQDSSTDVREKAALGLAFRSEQEVVDPLIGALGDESSQVREKAAIGLGLRRDPRAVDALLKAATDPDSQVREKVILGLGFSGDPRAIEVVAAAMKDPDDQVREKAVTAYTFLIARRR